MSGPKIVFGAPAPPLKLPEAAVKLVAKVTLAPAAVAPPPPAKAIVAPPCGPILNGTVIVPPGLP